MYNRKVLSLLVVIFIALIGMRYNVAFLAWVVFVPLLLLVRQTNGYKQWGWVALLLQIGSFLQIAKIITEPIPLFFAFMYSIPMALGMFVMIWLYEKMRRRVSDILGVFLFGAWMSLGDWLTFTTSEMGSWGAMLYTQIDNLALLQMSSLFGMTFPAFFIYLSSAFVTLFMVHQKILYRHYALTTAVIYLLFYGYGILRIHQPSEGDHIRVAGITSQMLITPQGIPSKEYLVKGTQELIDKTHQAITMGAKLIAWNEGATIITKEQEEAFVDKLKSISQTHKVDLVIAYIVPIDGIKSFENKYLFITQGEIVDEYFKKHPVPGEGAIKGETVAKAINLAYAKVSGAICYDFDFPYLGLKLAHQAIDLAVVPSSDWRGIDPIHAQMAMVRAVEGGYAMLRPVRGATSIAVDAYGRVRASMNYFEKHEHIMIASLPMAHTPTLYTKVGDIFVYALMLFIGGVFLGLRRKR